MKNNLTVHPFFLKLPKFLGINRSTSNCFMRGGINSIRAIVQHDPKRIWDGKRSTLTGLGEGCWDNLTQALEKCELHLGMSDAEVENWQPSIELTMEIGLGN